MPHVVQIEVPEPHAGQQKVIDEAGRFNVLECGRRFGKTTLGEFLLAMPAIQGHPVGWFAPTFKYLTEAWRNVLKIVQPLTSKVNVQERRIELTTGGVAEFWSLDDANAGRSRKYKRVIVDEAGIVRDLTIAWNEAIRPTLADLRGDAWFLGTPKGRGDFHRLFARGQNGDEGWKSWRLPTTSNPHIPPDEIEAARRDMPETAFNQEFLGIPADDGGNPFGLDSIKACTVDAISTEPAVAYGVDLAKSYDYTVVCGLDEHGRVCYLARWQSDWSQTRRKVLDIIGSTPACIDSTGVGDPIVEDIQRERFTAKGFKFTANSKQQLMEGLAAAIQRKEVSFPAGWLVNELEAFEYEYRPGGVRYSAPEGLHDDGVCALALAVQMKSEAVQMRFEVEKCDYVLTAG
jgi:terminase large subunit-like protein